MAGDWQNSELNDRRITSCAIVTTHANSKMARIHHRLPVILEVSEWSLWLGELGKGAATLMKPVTDDTSELCRVSNNSNSSRSSDASLWQPSSS